MTLGESLRRVRATRLDGRVARARRTRSAVVRALMELLNEGRLRPTARELAERASISLRSVFQHFEDLDSLYAAVADVQFARVEEMASAVAAEGTLEDRLRAFVERRTQVLETITPVRRAAVLQEPFSAEIANRLRWTYDMARAEVERVFNVELSAREGDARGELLHALDATSSWFAWETLRRVQGLSVDNAQRVMTLAMGSLLKKEA